MPRVKILYEVDLQYYGKMHILLRTSHLSVSTCGNCSLIHLCSGTEPACREWYNRLTNGRFKLDENINDMLYIANVARKDVSIYRNYYLKQLYNGR